MFNASVSDYCSQLMNLTPTTIAREVHCCTGFAVSRTMSTVLALGLLAVHGRAAEEPARERPRMYCW